MESKETKKLVLEEIKFLEDLLDSESFTLDPKIEMRIKNLKEMINKNVRTK